MAEDEHDGLARALNNFLERNRPIIRSDVECLLLERDAADEPTQAVAYEHVVVRDESGLIARVISRPKNVITLDQ